MPQEYRNTASQPVPPYGVLRVSGVEWVSPGRVRLVAGQFDRFGCQYDAVVNGPVWVPAGGVGEAHSASPCAVLYDKGDGTPVAGERWGPRAGGWSLRRQTGGFAVLGVTNPDEGLVLVQPAPMLSLIGKVDGAHNRGTTATVSIYAGPLGGETDTQHDLVGVYNRFGDVPAGKWVRCVWNDQHQQWELVTAEC